jgi:transcription initiation factor TFIIB
MEFSEKYLNMNPEDIDKLLLGFDINSPNGTIQNKKKSNNCVNCGSSDLIIDENHLLICSDCAVINTEFLDKNPEYSKNNNISSRYGCPSHPHFPKSGMGTKIKTKGWSRLSNLQSQGQMPYKEKSLLDEFKKIQARCKDKGITQPIIDTAKNLYKKVSESKHLCGKRAGKNVIMRCINRKSMIAACVFYACKLEGETRIPKEIAEIYNLEIKSVNRGCKKFTEIVDFDEVLRNLKSSQSSDFITRFAKKLNIKSDYINEALDISNNIHKLDLASTHEPPSVAAGCILLVANMHHLDLSKKKISDIFKISDVTISKTYRRIHPFYKIITNNQVTQLILDKKSKNTEKISITRENLVNKNDFLTESEESLTDSDSKSDENNYNSKSLDI